jgi:hypothetical protein
MEKFYAGRGDFSIRAAENEYNIMFPGNGPADFKAAVQVPNAQDVLTVIGNFHLFISSFTANI